MQALLHYLAPPMPALSECAFYSEIPVCLGNDIHRADNLTMVKFAYLKL